MTQPCAHLLTYLKNTAYSWSSSQPTTGNKSRARASKKCLTSQTRSSTPTCSRTSIRLFQICSNPSQHQLRSLAAPTPPRKPRIRLTARRRQRRSKIKRRKRRLRHPTLAVAILITLMIGRCRQRRTSEVESKIIHRPYPL